jgi:putative transposase
MPRRRPDVFRPLGTIWEVPEQAWERIKPILDEAYRPKPTGRPRIDFRAALNGIIYRARTGCQWNHLPREFGDDSSVHRWFQCWVKDGVFEKFWAVLLEECDELGGVDWEWQSADCCMGKARWGGEKRGRIPPTGPNPAPRRAS